MPKRLIITPSRFAALLIRRLELTLRGRNAIINVFELWIGLAGILTGIVFFYKPASIDHNSVSLALGETVATIWILGYMVGGALMWYGLLRPSPKWEVVGLWLLGTATAWNGLAIFEVFGFRGTASGITLLALTAAAWVRALVVQTVAMNLIERDRRTGDIRTRPIPGLNRQAGDE